MTHTHTHKPQVRTAEREENLARFRENEVPLLVCTDLASRGLDIPDVKQVGLGLGLGWGVDG